MNFNNSKLTLEEQKKIRSTNLYNVLGEIKKEFSIVENENDFTTNGKDIEDYVKFHIAKLEKSMYLHVDGLTELFRRMSKQTRTECCPLMIESSSTIYIDLDYYIINNENNQDMVEKFNKDIAKGIINDFKSIVPEDNNPGYILTFPSMINFDDKNKYYKCGAHCFIFFNKNILNRQYYLSKLVSKINSNQDLIELFDKFKDSIQIDNVKELKVSSLIDDQCFKRQGSMIFPLAQKDVNSRQYKIDEGDLSKIIIPKQYHEKKYCDNNGNSKLSNINDFEEEVRKQLQFVYGKTEEDQKEINAITRNLCWLYRMINSLAYLSDNHPFLKKFSKGTIQNNKDDKTNAGKFTTKVYKLTLLFMFLGGKVSPNIESSVMPNIVYSILRNLYVNGGKTNFEDIQKFVENHIDYINNPDDEDNVTESFNKFVSLLTNETIRENILINLKDPINKKKPENERKEIENQQIEFSEKINTILIEFAKFIDEQVIKHITNELMPFKKDDITRDILKFSFQDLNRNEEDKTFYDNTIKDMFELFLFCRAILFKGRNIIQESYDLIKTFMQYFVAFIDENDKCGYIYNVKQNNDICNQPFNQWISFSDSSNSSVKIWIKHLYENTYKEIFKNTIIKDRSFVDVINNICKYDHIINKLNEERLISNDEKSINTIVGEIYKQNLFNTEHKLYKILPHGSEYFAVFNGIIEYKQINGKYVANLLKVNENRISESCTYACYDPNYNIDNEYYRAIMDIFEDIYYDPEDREYMMKLFSSTVCPLIDKDVCVFAYGGGADGKTTIDKILLCALGTTGNSNGVKRDGEMVRVTKGHGTTIDTTVFTSPKSRGSADEGGLASLKGRTFAVMQEPIHNTPVISSNIKEITGIGGIRAREIYKNSDEFINNALVICETNQLPTFDVIDEAIQRRVVVYQHEVKFITKTNKKYYRKVDQKYKKDADQDKIKLIESDPKYWDALIYILVQKALELLNQGIKSLENIERPENIKTTTDLTFTKASKIIIWLENNVYQITDTESCYRWAFSKFFKMVKEIDEMNNLSLTKKGNNQSIFNTDNDRGKAESLINAIVNKYGCHFYKIKEEFMLKPNNQRGKDKYYRNLDHIINESTANMTNEEFIEKYTDGSALINIEMSHSSNYEDIVIVDINFNDAILEKYEFNSSEKSKSDDSEELESNNFEEPKIIN